jgi:fibronectin type 3 domain-containing protein
MRQDRSSFILHGIILVLLAIPAGMASLGSGTGNGISDPAADIYGGSGVFIENGGQYDPSIQFMAGTSNGHVALTANGILIDLRSVDRENDLVEGYVAEIAFEGANPVLPVGDDMAVTEYNYFFGKDPSGWVTGAHGYRTVTYRDLWDGIDLIYRFTEKGLKYDLVVAPGADPTDISFSTGDLPVTGRSDSISIRTPMGDLTDSGLVAHDGSGRSVEVSFDIGENGYGFDVGSYDGSQTLTIDPNMNVVQFSTYVGGSGYDSSYDSDIDSSGNLYVCGQTDSYDFPSVKGHYQSFLNGYTDGFLFKMDPTGKSLLLATYIGGSDSDYATSVRVDGKQNIFLAGLTSSSDFPTTDGAYNESIYNYTGWMNDFFILKFDSRVTTLLFSTYVGGAQDETVSKQPSHCLDIDADGNVYFAGTTYSANFPVTADAYQNTLTGGSGGGPKEWWAPDIVMFELSSDGTSLLYATFLGGMYYEYVSALEYRDPGLVYLGGATESDDFNVTKNAFSTTKSGWTDAIISVLSVIDCSLIYSTFIGGISSQMIADIDVDASGTVYACGVTYSSDFPVRKDAYSTQNNGEDDGFVLAIDISSNVMNVSTYIGGTSSDSLDSLMLDSNSDIHLAGVTNSGDFPVKEGSFQDVHSDPDQGGWRWSDVLYVKMESDGTDLVYSTFIGGPGYENCVSVFLDVATGLPIVIGSTESPSFPVTEDAYQITLNGFSDVFLIEIDLILPPLSPMNPMATPGDDFVNITWEEPIFDGGAPIEYYLVSKGIESGDYLWEEDAGLNLFFNDTNATNGKIYFYAIRAVNSAGPGPYSDEVMSMPASVPSPPENFTVIYGSELVNISWDPPSDAGGLRVLGYILFKSTSSGPFVPIEIDSGFWSFSDVEVENGIDYEYYMVALNILGPSEPTPILNATPRYRPLSPVDVVSGSGPGFVVLSWLPPEFDGGAPVLGYYVYKANPGQLYMRIAKLSSDVLSYNDTDVVNGRIYDYSIASYNSEGESDLSEKASGRPVSRPSPPLDVEAIPGDGSITVKWDPPADTGGLLITYYNVFRAYGELLEKVRTATNGEEEYVDTTVSNGRTYTYYVTAKNSEGESAPSVSATATPQGKPSQPLDLKAVAGNGYVLLSWVEPGSTGGAPISSYWVLRGTSASDLRILTNVSGLEYNDTTAVNGIAYVYAVKAVNIIGFSPQSNPVFANPLGLPGMIESVDLLAGDGWVEITWSLPSFDGGSDIVQVTLYRSASGGAPIEINPPNKEGTYRDNGLQNGVTYSYSLAAANSLGVGPMSEVYNATPSGNPGAPGALKLVIQKGSPYLTWQAPGNNGGSPIIGYRIYRASGSGSETNIGFVPATETAFLDSGAEPGKYTYTVTALNKNGESAQSGVQSISVKEAESSNLPIIIIGLLVLLLLAALITIAVLMNKVSKAKVAKEQAPAYYGMPPANQMMMPQGVQQQQLAAPQVQQQPIVPPYVQESLPPVQGVQPPATPEVAVSYPPQEPSQYIAPQPPQQ